MTDTSNDVERIVREQSYFDPSYLDRYRPQPNEIRLQLIPNRFDGKKWHHEERQIVRLGDVGKWSLVRRADSNQAMPYVISRKEWDKMAPAPTDTPPETSD